MPYRLLVLPFDEATEQFDSGELDLLEERFDIRQCRANGLPFLGTRIFPALVRIK